MTVTQLRAAGSGDDHAPDPAGASVATGDVGASVATGDVGASVATGEVGASVATGDMAASLQGLLDAQRAAHLADPMPSVALRRNRIDRLLALVLENSDQLVDAIVADFGSKSHTATLSTEIVGMIGNIAHTRKNLKKWMRPRKALRGSRITRLSAEVVPTPLGVVGVIGPWNFPLHLVIMPTAAAFAAGNRVMIKMSEITPNTAETLKSLADKYFDPIELAVVTGDLPVATAFSELPFDHLFFTGSPGVGKRIQAAAAANLVPVTLELGGKNPVMVSRDADIVEAAQRIALGRMANGGQVCICPDHVYVPVESLDVFVASAVKALRKHFPTVTDNPDYPSCVNDANYRRVRGLVDDARDKGANITVVAPVHQVDPDPDTRKIAPTLVTGITDDMTIAGEEIFGPVLGISTYTRVGEVIDALAGKPAPLVAYWFGPDTADFRDFVRRTRSGGVARNEFGIHMLPSDAPFGGVGNSGMGAYHGKAGFDRLSHDRSVVGTDLPMRITTSSAVPPFGTAARKGMDLMLLRERRRVRRRVRMV